MSTGQGANEPDARSYTMKLKTDVILPVLPDLPHSEKLTLLGSCFTEYIGKYLKEGKFNCELNPFGILFNPLSILQGLERLQENRLFTTDELFSHRGLWHSLWHHGSFSASTPEATLRNINETFCQAALHLAQSRFLILTWGTSFVYKHRRTDLIVANCHKLPATDFERIRISVGEITACYRGFLNEWLAADPGRKVLLTVSPVRHLRDGLHENQLSKSILLLAAEGLQEKFPGRVFYFPAYEIMMDELRDYRFCEADMVHPTPLATAYIYERFSQCCFSPETLRASDQCRELHRMLAHRPLHPEIPEYRAFIQRIETKIATLQQNYPYLSFTKEMELCRTL